MLFLITFHFQFSSSDEVVFPSWWSCNVRHEWESSAVHFASWPTSQTIYCFFSLSSLFFATQHSSVPRFFFWHLIVKRNIFFFVFNEKLDRQSNLLPDQLVNNSSLQLWPPVCLLNVYYQMNTFVRLAIPNWYICVPRTECVPAECMLTNKCISIHILGII